MFSRLLILACLLLGSVVTAVSAADVANTDVVVYGATPGGIASALSAARLGNNVTLVAYNDHVGGMMTSGLGKSDIEDRAMIQGLFAEFIGNIRSHYMKTYGADHRNVELCRDGYYFEPSVAEAVFEQMLRSEPTIRVMKGWRLTKALVVETVRKGSDHGGIFRSAMSDQTMSNWLANDQGLRQQGARDKLGAGVTSCDHHQ